MVEHFKMEIKLNFSLKHFNSSTIGLYDYILQERSNSNSTIAAHINIPDANELFEIIGKEFEELRQPTTLASILKILDITIQQTSTSTSTASNFMKNLLDKHSSNDEDHIIATQIIYQILSSLPNDFPVEEFRSSGFITEIIHNADVDNAKVQTQLALCKSLLIEKFQIYTLLEIIWEQILIKRTHYLLVHYIDLLISQNRIYERSKFWKLIHTHLSADSRDDRKLGIFLIRKTLRILSNAPTVIQIENFFEWSKDSTDQFLTSWLTYLTILENLEEKQSHLILPSLEMLDSVTLGDNTPWIRIVLLQMLKHNNTLVLRWTIDYLYRNFLNLVLNNQILQEFLQATNNTWLYNDNFTNTFILPAFNTNEQKIFLEVFAEVPWKSVPMHVWLLRMKTVSWSGIENKLIINIAARLRQLQNRFIRSNCRDIFIPIFKSCIDDMPLHDFINFLDALYSSTDCLSEELLSALVHKIQMSPCPFISCNLCTILRNQYICSEYESILMDTFDEVKVEDHQWFCILARFGFVPSIQQHEFCKKHYNIHISNPDMPNLSLEEVMSEYVSKLSWDDISKAVVRLATIDWFTSRSSFAEIIKNKCVDLLDSAGVRSLNNIASGFCHSRMDPAMLYRFLAELRNLAKKIMDTDLLVWTLIKTCAKDEPDLLYKYVNEMLDIDVTNNGLAVSVFKSILSFIDHHKAEARQLLIRGLLFGEPLSGDLRIEHYYATRTNLLKYVRDESAHEVRYTCLRFLKRLDEETREILKTDLIAQSKSMSIRKPRYFENSKHHRLKLRIAQALAAINQITSVWNDYYLFALLEENNQTNVTYIYEFIVAVTISSAELMKQIENLKNLSTSGQVSIFAISYLFTKRYKTNDEFVEKLITLLLPWTMGSNFNTRLYAQITIYHLLKEFQIDSFNYLKIGIEMSLKESPNAYEKLVTDVRYNFPGDFEYLDTEPILYVTVVAEDENWQLEDICDNEFLKEARRFNLSKRILSKDTENELILSKPVIEDVQRKMNPEMSLSYGHSSKPEVAKTDMIIVASLIDKLPNLGGIARTCEVLGIRNLVLDSIKHTQNKEFKNLSMTAENWINISEVKPKGLRQFLINKRTDGYEIVGAEQTAKSINFMEFKFPSKCVLLLGHEKEGIPAELLSFLDYAVEIPQFGMVRSLNVHVTGALFMYEYCKQILSKPK